MAEIIVLGAGMVGVGSALALQQRGHAVTLIDKSEPGRETSYGNAGIIQVEAVEPYELPRDLMKLTRFGLGLDNAVNYHALSLPHFVGPLWQYFRNSAPRRHRESSRHYSSIIKRCLQDHDPLITAAGSDNLIKRDGYRQGYRSAKAFDSAVAHAERLRAEYGVSVTVQDSAALAAAEPNLLQPMAGALHWTESWTCADPGALVASYAALLVSRGGRFLHGDAGTLSSSAAGWRVTTSQGELSAEHVVLALGPWTPALLKRFSYSIPMIGKRGYHRHYRIEKTLTMPLYDTANATVLCPMRQGLRVTTGAELAPLDAPLTPRQLDKAEAGARELLALGDALEGKPWMGVRPCMPDMLPVIGPLPRHKGLWVNFGHGHQGFTLGPTTGELLAEEMSSPGTPSIVPFLPSRWRGL